MECGTCKDCWWMPINGPCSQPFLNFEDWNPQCFAVYNEKIGIVEEYTTCRAFTPKKK